MPNTSLRAAAEGLPASNLSRRSFLRAMPVAGAAVALPTIAVAAPAVSDPLVEAINAYRAGMQDYNGNSPDDTQGADDYIEVSYGPPMERLEAWKAPAITRKGAVEALRLAIKENSDYYANSLVGSMVLAALGYLEQNT